MRVMVRASTDWLSLEVRHREPQLDPAIDSPPGFGAGPSDMEVCVELVRGLGGRVEEGSDGGERSTVVHLPR